VIIDNPGQLPENDQPFVVRAHKGEYSFIPGQQIANGKLLLDLHDGIKKDGFYDLMLDDSKQYVLAYNYSRSESQLDFFTADELSEQIESEGIKNAEVLSSGESSFTEMLNTVHKESQLWKLFIIFALLMLLSEVLILRYWK